MRFYAEYHANTILQPLVAEISWSKHNVKQKYFPPICLSL